MDSGGASEGNMAIFKQIADILTDPEFNEALSAFYAANHPKFDEAEENKLEYKNIYEEYITITEKVIEEKLMVNHGIDNDAFKAFLEDFKVNKAAYEADDAETVDALYVMIDFE